MDVLEDDLQVDKVLRSEQTQFDKSGIAQTQIELLHLGACKDFKDILVSFRLLLLYDDPESHRNLLE